MAADPIAIDTDRALSVSTPTTWTSPASTPFLPLPPHSSTPDSLVADDITKPDDIDSGCSLLAAAADAKCAGHRGLSLPIMFNPTLQEGVSAPSTEAPLTSTTSLPDVPSSHLTASQSQTSPVSVSGHQPQAVNSQGAAADQDVVSAFLTPEPGSPATNISSTRSEEPVPLRTASVRRNTKIAHPKPIALPAAGNPLTHPTPDLNYRAGAFVGNVAQLEATAERISTGTSSMAEAIRDLHGELKRSDSRRSSILAASVRGSAADDSHSTNPPISLKRHLSTSSSIVSTNIAARHGGYSPAGFVMSPSHSMDGLLRSASKSSASGRPEIDLNTVLARHGPGKASVRSVRSSKLSLAEISETEPISLQNALDEADAAPPIDTYDANDDTLRPMDSPVDEDATVDFHKMLDDTFNNTHKPAPPERPSSSHSNDTFQQAKDAFIDFDGVHWDEVDEPFEAESKAAHLTQAHDNLVAQQLHHDVQPEQTRVPPRGAVRPQSYIDPGTGHHMLYYPARVPAMLNLPPKLSHKKPAPVSRDQRRSQVLNSMQEISHEAQKPKREKQRDSWLPDPIAGQRNSFAALSLHNDLLETDLPQEDQAIVADETRSELATEDLQRPEKLAQIDGNKRKSRMSHLPPQLRASAFFDLPSKKADIEIKNGSAMASFDNMLDASMNAPVSAFTDHTYGGRLGPEVYGATKKHKSKISTSSAVSAPVLLKEPKKRASRLWFTRGSSYNSEQKSTQETSALGEHEAGTDSEGSESVRRSIDGESVVIRVPHGHADDPEDEERSEDEGEIDEGFHGQPNTLLAELQLRKQQQKQRTQPLSKTFPNGMHATLLEMDAVAEAQRKNRNAKRVNLAWEEPHAHGDQNGPDDEDVPLAIIAAKAQGAKNMANLERPIGLMERRQMEDNEPLSQRRARLQGQDMHVVMPKRQSMVSLSAHLTGHVRTPSAQIVITPEPEEDDEVEGETLGERRKRLAAAELPKARPVSGAFSAELLSQFGELDDVKGSSDNGEKKVNGAGTPPVVEDETLGQRRRRLQAEREAREREMSYSNLIGRPTNNMSRRSSMADILASNPKKDGDNRGLLEKQRMEQERYAAVQHDAKMAAMRNQMPQALVGPNVQRSGGFLSGVYNDGTGGFGARSTSAVHTQGFAQAPKYHRSSTALSGNYGMQGQQQQQQQQQQQVYAGMNNMAAYNNYLRGNTASMYGGNQMAPGVQMPLQATGQPGGMDRVEQWRHGVMP